MDLLAAFVIILLGAHLFVAGVEWLGKKLGVGEGVVGSVFAAVGTALPETMIPVIAILFGNPESREHISLGAILGAPFMLSTLAMFLVGVTICVMAILKKRSFTLTINASILKRDLFTFIIAFSVAAGASLMPPGILRMGATLFLLGIYGLYVFLHVKDRDSSRINEQSLPHLYLSRAGSEPSMLLVISHVALGLTGIILGAFLFVDAIEYYALIVFGVPIFIFSLTIAPIATELPEKVNSILWARQGKDTLALGNLSGAMVFQSAIPVALGIMLTSWHLNTAALVVVALTLIGTAIIAGSLLLKKGLDGRILLICGIPYATYILYLLTNI